MKTIINTGVAEDTRNSIQKSLDWKAEDILGSASPYVWKEFNEADIPQYTKRNQDGSGMCGPFSGTKALGIVIKKLTGEYFDLLPPFIYKLRTNKGAGMYLQELLEIACKRKAPYDKELKGDNLNEDQANSYTITDAMFAEALEILKDYDLKYAFINPKDLDEIARVIDLGWTPIILLRCDISEWTTEPYVNQQFTSPFNINHFNPLVYSGKIADRRKYVSDDSWGSSYGKNGQRTIDEDFMLKRVEQIGYVFAVKKGEVVVPPFKFEKNLFVGMRNVDVLWLQKRLVAEGFATFTPTGYFGYLSLKAVVNYQKAKGITPAYGYVGAITRAELNK